MIEVYKYILQENNFSNISDINFSCKTHPNTYYFDYLLGFPKDLKVPGMEDHKIIKSTKIQYSKREPAEKLRGEDMGKLLVAMYAWDGNSYPGNEYWNGNLTASGDPAAGFFFLT